MKPGNNTNNHKQGGVMVNEAKVGGVYKKLATARAKLTQCKFNKSGKNTYQGFEYYELKDFMPDVLKICSEVGLCGHLWIDEKEAFLNIVDCEDGSVILFREPLTSLSLSGKPQPIQNLGGLKTYHRRYLWMDAMEISENDAVDSSDQRADNIAIIPLKNALTKAIDLNQLSAAFYIASAIDKNMVGNVIALLTKPQQDKLYNCEEYKALTDKKQQTNGENK